jgi:membrane-associated phospholipid phosphatase
LAPERRRYLKLALFGYVVWLVCFELVGRLAARLPTHDLRTSLDLTIPLWPPAVWVYEACYLLPLIPALLVRDFQRLNIGILAALLANLSAFVVYFAFPVAFPRPPLGDSWAERVLAFEYAWDFQPGANKLPSLHVATSWLTWLICLRQGLPALVVTALGLLAIAISVSTLFVKQHLVIDVVFGMAWAFGWFALATRLYRAWCARSGRSSNASEPPRTVAFRTR